MTEPQQAKTRRGCLFYGCIVGVIFMLMLLAGLLIGMRMAKRMVNDFTDSRPMELPAVKLTSEEIEQVRTRVKTFNEDMKAGRSTPPLTLTADEINALIVTDPEAKGLKGKMYVTIQGDQVKSAVSMPMGELGLGLFKKRYLNGDATLSVSLRNGILRVYAHDINVKGKPLPAVYMQKIRDVNWADGFNNDTNASAALNKLQSIEVKDGKVLITPAEKPPPNQ